MKGLFILYSLTRSKVKEQVKISVFGAEQMNVILLVWSKVNLYSV